MHRLFWRLSILLTLVLVCSARADRPSYDRAAAYYNGNVSWHGPHAHTMWGAPVALVLPPNVYMQTNYSWGVARTRMSPVYHQFARPVAVPYSGGRFRPAPVWPSDTTQFGVYSVRAPW